MDSNITIQERHEEICDNIHATYLQKNSAYGDSFHELYKEIGIISALTQIAHKYNRFKNLAKNRDNEIDTGDESIKDTLIDMANYCILTVMEIERENN